MKNTIKVTIPFSFKGINYEPSCIIDLDTFLLGEQSIDSIFQLVAAENNIDNYSYEYEVLESSKKIFSEPTGLAGNFLSDGNFDIEGFKQSYRDEQVFASLNDIAKKNLNIDNLDDHADIKQALLSAYQAGQSSKLDG